MERWSILGETLGAIADGARNALGEFGQLTPAQMASRLADVRTVDRHRVSDVRPYAVEWSRPEGWPDIDALLDADPATDVIYMTYDADQLAAAIAWHVETADRQAATLEIGHVEGGEFVADETDAIAHNTNYGRWTDDLSGLVVLRLTGQLSRCYTFSYVNSGRTQQFDRQPVLQRAARVPHLTAFSPDYRYYRWGVTSLERDRVENGDGSALTSLAVAWYFATALRSLDISGLRTPKVTSLARAFGACNALRSLDLSGLDTSKVTTMTYAFSNCNSLASLDLSGNDFGRVTDWSYAFNACWCLTSVTGLAATAATNVSYMFQNCYCLRSLDLSSCDLGAVGSMAYMFSGCTALAGVTFPAAGPAPTSMAYAFNNCYSLRGLDLASFDMSRVTTFALAFCNCYALRGVRFPDTANEVATSVGQMFDGCWSLLGVGLSWLKLSNKCTNICYMFRECRELRALDMPAWDLTGLSSAANMSHSVFLNCRSLKRVTGISGWQFRHTNTIGSMFSGCWSLEEVDVSGWDVSTVNSLASLFSECVSLRELDLSAWRPRDTSISLVSMFNNCNSLMATGDLSGWDVQPTTVATMFNGCTNLREFPDITQWDMSLCTTTASMFANCWSLTEMDLHGLDMPKCTTVASMFNACYNLRSLDVGGWSLPALNTAPATFAGNCWNLRDLVPPSFPLNHSYTACHSLSQESVLAIIDALPAVTAARTLNLNASNLLRLTAEEKAVATAKKWTLAN